MIGFAFLFAIEKKTHLWKQLIAMLIFFFEFGQLFIFVYLMQFFDDSYNFL